MPLSTTIDGHNVSVGYTIGQVILQQNITLSLHTYKYTVL